MRNEMAEKKLAERIARDNDWHERRREYERKADQAAHNIGHAMNRDLAIRTFFRYLLLSVDPDGEVNHGR